MAQGLLGLAPSGLLVDGRQSDLAVFWFDLSLATRISKRKLGN